MSKKKNGRMYKDTKAWNPFVGCESSAEMDLEDEEAEDDDI